MGAHEQAEVWDHSTVPFKLVLLKKSIFKDGTTFTLYQYWVPDPLQ